MLHALTLKFLCFCALIACYHNFEVRSKRRSNRTCAKPQLFVRPIFGVVLQGAMANLAVAHWDRFPTEVLRGRHPPRLAALASTWPATIEIDMPPRRYITRFIAQQQVSEGNNSDLDPRLS